MNVNCLTGPLYRADIDKLAAANMQYHVPKMIHVSPGYTLIFDKRLVHAGVAGQVNGDDEEADWMWSAPRLHQYIVSSEDALPDPLQGDGTSSTHILTGLHRTMESDFVGMRFYDPSKNYPPSS
jgi:hypothetical protein